MLPFPLAADITPAPPGDAATRDWFARVSLGVSSVAASEESDLLAKEGYDSGRFMLLADGAWTPASWVGAGGFVGWETRSVSPDEHGPSLYENVLLGGIEAPFLLGSRSFAMILTPRLGYGGSRLTLHDGGTYVRGFVFGAEAAAISRTLHLGAALGFFYAPTPAPGDAGRPYDFGGVHFALQGILDG